MQVNKTPAYCWMHKLNEDEENAQLGRVHVLPLKVEQKKGRDTSPSLAVPPLVMISGLRETLCRWRIELCAR